MCPLSVVVFQIPCDLGLLEAHITVVFVSLTSPKSCPGNRICYSSRIPAQGSAEGVTMEVGLTAEGEQPITQGLGIRKVAL